MLSSFERTQRELRYAYQYRDFSAVSRSEPIVVGNNPVIYLLSGDPRSIACEVVQTDISK